MDYLTGTDVLGTVLTLKFTDLPGLIKSQGGAAGAIAYQALPETIENKVYSITRDQILDQMKEKGIAAAVNVVADKDAPSGAPKRDLYVGLGLGAGVLAIGYGLVRWLRSRR